MPDMDAFLKIAAQDITQLSRVPVKILPDPASLFLQFARSLADEIKANNEANQPTRVILPVGPIGQYPYLVEICNQERISWRNTFTFNMDEYCDWQGRWIPADHPLSFRGNHPPVSIRPLASRFTHPRRTDPFSRSFESRSDKPGNPGSGWNRYLLWRGWISRAYRFQ